MDILGPDSIATIVSNWMCDPDGMAIALQPVVVGSRASGSALRFGRGSVKIYSAVRDRGDDVPVRCSAAVLNSGRNYVLLRQPMNC